jgi:hypothetical protein
MLFMTAPIEETLSAGIESAGTKNLVDPAPVNTSSAQAVLPSANIA